jgi:hypothetical protein
MKKYLMTGVAAIALCAAFTSCSKGGDEIYDPDFGNKVVAATYEDAFRSVFGNPAPTQEWGFGSAAGTRNNGQDGAINVNGNMWTECPGVKVNEEVDAIFNYVKNGTEWMTANNKPFSTTAPKNLNGYFVTQVRSGNNNYVDNTYPLTYNQGGGEISNVGTYMNHLQIAFNQNPSMADLNAATSENVSGWEHINNFNASANINWSNAESAEKGNTKVENKGAYDFAYHSSYDSKYHNKWILVDGANISSDPYYADFYYVCFDFESVPTGNTTYYTYTNSNGQQNINGELNGTFFTNEEVAAELAKQGITDRTDINISRYLYGDKMVKGDNKYTDWIIRITKGEPENQNKETDWIRVMGEDLNANDPSDFDFNDIVIDIRITKTGAECILQAAGGTMPLRINGDDNLEVHKLFGVPTNKMVNTGAENTPNPDDPTKMLNGISGLDPVPFTLTGRFDGVKSVKIEVNKGGWKELTAERGVPASKIGTPKNTNWCPELKSIKFVYPEFTNWVTTNTNYAGVWK